MAHPNGTNEHHVDHALLRARDKLDEALARSPEQPGLLMMRARASSRCEAAEEAGAWWLRAAQAHEGRPEAIDCLREAASCLQQAGAGDDACDAWEQVLELEASDGHRLAFGRCLYDLGHRDQARRELQAVADCDDHDLAGQACELLARFTPDPLPWARRGVEHAAKARQRPEFGRRLVQLSSLHREAGDVRKAEAYLERARPYLGDEVASAVARSG